jgi:hypothetical protein
MARIGDDRLPTEKTAAVVGAAGLRNRIGAVLCATIAGCFAAFMFWHIRAILGQSAPYPFDDFFAIWSYAKVVMTHPASTLYDFSRLHTAQVALGMAPASEKPFPYPPVFIFMVLPLGLLSYLNAYAVWMGVTLFSYTCAVCRGSRPLGLMLAGTWLAPATTFNVAGGQSGFLLGALLIGGIRLMERRPVAAGVLFGLLSYKPQFGILVPVMLVAARQWRCIAATCMTLVVLAGISILAFGTEIWVDWLHSLSTYSTWFNHRMIGRLFRTTVYDNFHLLGLSPEVITTAQIIATALGVILVWVSFRRGQRECAVPIMLAATCLAVPHAFIYDMTILTGAVLFFVGYRLRSEIPFSLPEMAILVLALWFPAVMWDYGLPISSAAIISFILFVLIRKRQAETVRIDAAANAALLKQM